MGQGGRHSLPRTLADDLPVGGDGDGLAEEGVMVRLMEELALVCESICSGTGRTFFIQQFCPCKGCLRDQE